MLWLVSLLTLLATATAVVSVSHRRAAQRLAERVTLEASADGAIRIAMLRIIAPAAAAQPVTAGMTLELEMPGGPAQVAIQRERGRLDLNSADEQLIFALFVANGWEAQRAHAMAARIADWTDADDDRREGGAEASDYTAAGRPYGPRNGPFESVEELRQLLGSEDIAPDLFDALTVYTHERVPSLRTSESVVRALRYAEANHLGDRSWLPEGGVSAQGGAVIQDTARAFEGEVLRVRACAGREDAKRCRLAIVRVTGSNQHPLQIYDWRTTPAPARTP
ncbi:MAG: hypothetical protein WDO56_16090 [Gammaproteobacteria bacterium]